MSNPKYMCNSDSPGIVTPSHTLYAYQSIPVHHSTSENPRTVLHVHAPPHTLYVRISLYTIVTLTLLGLSQDFLPPIPLCKSIPVHHSNSDSSGIIPGLSHHPIPSMQTPAGGTSVIYTN